MATSTSSDTRPFMLECATCDAKINDAVLALLRGWSSVGAMTEDIPGCEDVTHCGQCPACTDGTIAASN